MSARPWSLCYGSLKHVAGNALWDLFDEPGISVFGTRRNWISAVVKAGINPPENTICSLKTPLSSRSQLAPESNDFVNRDGNARAPRIHLADTEIVSCVALRGPLPPVYRGELPCRVLRIEVEILGYDGTSVCGEGELAFAGPFP